MARLSTRGTSVFILCVFAIWGGLFFHQRQYIRENYPRLKTELAAADGAGAGLLEEIGLPPGATVVSPVQKKVLNASRRSVWRYTPVAVVWTGAWDAPGDHAGMLAWYDEHLLPLGWKPYHERIPSALQTLYWKDKWLLAIEHNVSFPTDHPPHARVQLRLTWDFQHQLEQTSTSKCRELAGESANRLCGRSRAQFLRNFHEAPRRLCHP